MGEHTAEVLASKKQTDIKVNLPRGNYTKRHHHAPTRTQDEQRKSESRTGYFFCAAWKETT